ncbi:MAG: RNA polymerase subunit sigma-70, partial [Phycisphaeraceae bacterium]|nr:RNA polymerase subunit sigma-70 [Phycisphaeraceae bacterium]
MIVEQLHPALAELIECSRQRGFMTYDELNTCLPDELVDPERIDELLAYLESLHVRLVDSQTHQSIVPKGVGPVSKIAEADLPPEQAGEEVVVDEEEIKKDLAQALQEASDRRIDDPVRMYLTQMGEISLLTRDEEIRLAKKIEVTRMIFRRRVLESDYCVNAAVDILELVNDGDLPFDRTMKISTAEEDAKGKIAARIPENLKTVRRLLELDRQDWATLEEGRKRSEPDPEVVARLATRRRKMATLIEELSLRTSKIQPLMKKLRSIKEKMVYLQK